MSTKSTRPVAETFFKTLGGETVTIPIRGKHYIQPRGYARKPGTGPEGETCATCIHMVKNRKWNKCGLAQGKWTGGRGSDILASSPACELWKPIPEWSAP